MERHRTQLWISKLLRRVGELTARSSVAALVAVTTFVAASVLAATGFGATATSIFTVVTASVALVMLFVIQHTQSREQSATQLKLDELIRTSPLADDHLVHIEAAEDLELIERESAQAAHHTLIREEDDAVSPEDLLWTPGDSLE